MESEQKKTMSWVAICLLFVLTVSCSSTKTLIVLLPDENNPNGAVTIDHGDRTTLLDVPMIAAEVDAYGPVEKQAVTRAEVERNFAQALAAQPPDPISFILYNSK